jgi:hypothetical protein
MTRKRKTIYVGYFPGRHSFYHAARDRSSYILPNGMYSNQARGCLKKCWTGFRIDPVFYGILLTFIFTFSKLVGWIFFGIAFWMVARSISPDSIVRKCMVISAYGLLLLFISYQANGIVVTSYPPFGLATISFMGLSSYLILVGIYSAAISVSEEQFYANQFEKLP